MLQVLFIAEASVGLWIGGAISLKPNPSFRSIKT
jgi:hypothetical protein